MWVNFRSVEDTNEGVFRYKMHWVQEKDLEWRFRLSNLEWIDTSAEPVVIYGIEYFPWKTKLRPISIGNILVKEEGRHVRPEQDWLFSKDGKLLHIGQNPQVRKWETRTDWFLWPITPITSWDGDDNPMNDLHYAHWINQNGEPVYVNGEAMEWEYQMYENTAIWELMRINVNSLHSIFANITPDWKVVYVWERDIDLVGKLQDSVFWEVSILLPRGLWVWNLVDKELNIVREWISNITTFQDQKLWLLTQMPYSKWIRRTLTFDSTQEEIDYSEMKVKNIVKTSQGIFTNIPEWVVNSSQEPLIIWEKKVIKISYGYDMPQDSYMIQFEWDEKMTMVKWRVLKWKDLY